MIINKIESLIIREKNIKDSDVFFKLPDQPERSSNPVYSVEVETLYNNERVYIEFSLVIKRCTKGCQVVWDDQAYNVSIHKDDSVEPWEVRLASNSPVLNDLYLTLLLKGAAPVPLARAAV